MLINALLLVLSFVILYYGAEIGLNSAERIGKALNMSKLVVGLVLVGLGTSLPEFFVCQIASYRGNPGLAIGNIVGSNVGNMFMILGVTGFLTQLNLSHFSIRGQLKLNIGITLLLALVTWPTKFYPVMALLLLVFFFYFLFHSYFDMKKSQMGALVEDDQAVTESIPTEKMQFIESIKLLSGFAMLYAGGELLVYAGTEFGNAIGISNYVMSVIFVAMGTSFPELITSLVACIKRKDTDLITGNIIGSNIFNISFVMGSLGAYQFSFDRTFYVEISFLLAAGIYLYLMSKANRTFAKKSGALFVVCYLILVGYWVGDF